RRRTRARRELLGGRGAACPRSGPLEGAPAEPGGSPAGARGAMTRVVVGHLYPNYLNIYADRGNIAVLARRAAWRGLELEVRAVSMRDVLRPGEHDLLYVGGGQDREQALVAPDLAAKGEAVREAAAGGAAALAGCG